MKKFVSLSVFSLMIFSFNCGSHSENLRNYVFVGDFRNHILKKYILSDIKADSGFYDLANDTALVAKNKFLTIDSERKTEINGHSVYSLKFMIKQRANYKHQNNPNEVGSESTRLIIYNKRSGSKFKVLFDTKFYQPVCEVPEYSLDTIQPININSTKLISVDLKYCYLDCCGCSEVDSLISYVFDKNFKLVYHYNTLIRRN
ncbi:MAG: hypothetical protein Q8904_00610 [Bacteroidota bacterium]|nr:hypothetical protein [Bacteroidota bacterium]